MTAYFSAPIDNGNVEASFHSREEADEFAAEYGGSVFGTGVVFTVRGADTDRAKADIKSARNSEAAAAAERGNFPFGGGSE